jgi:transposase
MDTNGSGRRRRTWSEALKREIVAASFEPGASVSIVARRYDINANQLFSWRRLYGEDQLATTGLKLVPVAVTPEPPSGEPIAVGLLHLIEIDVPGGYRVRVGPDVDGKALRRVLDVLARL